jgi:hypothetical protein
MKVWFPTAGNCAVCGTAGEYPPTGPTYQEGETFDLDLRTSEPTRSLIRTWVRCCPNCGYCSLNIFLPVTPAIRQVVASKGYAKQLQDPNFPVLANRFLCSAVAASTLNDPAIPGWETLRAAWVCDDARLQQQAIDCRLKAAAFFEESMEETPELATMWLVSDWLLCDLLRRTDQFDKVRQIAKLNLLRPLPAMVESLLRYQVILAENGDTGCHTFEEARVGAPAYGALRN